MCRANDQDIMKMMKKKRMEEVKENPDSPFVFKQLTAKIAT